MHYRTPLYLLRQPVGFHNTSSEPRSYSPEVRRAAWVRRKAGPIGSTASQRAVRRELRALHPGLSDLDAGRVVAVTTTASLSAWPATLPADDDDDDDEDEDEDMDDSVLDNMSDRIGPVLEGVQTTSGGEVDEDSVMEGFNGNLDDNVSDSSEGTVTGVYFSDPVWRNMRLGVQPRVFVNPGPSKVSGDTPIESRHPEKWWHKTAEEIAAIPRAQMRNQTYHVIRIMETTLGQRRYLGKRCSRCVRDGHECWVYSKRARKEIIGNAGHKCARCRSYDSQRPCNFP
jgi:hypothetical protein